MSLSMIPVASASGSLNLIPPEKRPYGLSYEDHIKNFWKWILSIPADKTPWKIDKGKNCDNGQSIRNSSVFYLSGSGSGSDDRICSVPAGRSLFIPISPMEISTREAPNETLSELNNDATQDQDRALTVDLILGDKVFHIQDLRMYRVHTGFFNVTYPKNPIFGASPGKALAVADGYYAITEPLKKGTYSIEYKNILPPLPVTGSTLFSQDVRYKIIAK